MRIRCLASGHLLFHLMIESKRRALGRGVSLQVAKKLAEDLPE
jgi:hypothetical protein